MNWNISDLLNSIKTLQDFGMDSDSFSTDGEASQKAKVVENPNMGKQLEN